MLLSDSAAKAVIEIFVVLLTIVIIFYRWRFRYWKTRNVPYIKPRIPFGNLNSPLRSKEHLGITFKKLYQKIKANGWKHGGIYMMTTPTYLVTDLDYLRNILIKDFHHFVDRGLYYNEKDDPLSAHLFAIGGQKWKNLRTKMTPTFTSGKMKMMFQILLDCVPNLNKKIDLDVEQKKSTDIKNALACFTTDIIGSCAFGLDLKTFEGQSPFRIYGDRIFESSRLQNLKITFAMNFPNIARQLGIKVLQNDVSSFFMNVVKDAVNYRESNHVTRKDFMQLLIDLKNNKLTQEEGYKHDGQTLTIEELAAQSFVFFLAGFETSSTTMTFALYELASNPKLQEQVRCEIDDVLQKHEGKITYEAIQELKYMDQVLNETLRKYPPVSFITRTCVKDYKIPTEDIILEAGTRVLVPIYAIHHDESYYPNPEIFDPDRFNDHNKATRHHLAHIPFGEGPRLCIGMRFGLMQSKVGLAALLKNYKFSVSSKTKQPLALKVTSIFLAAEGEIWLDTQKL